MFLFIESINCDNRRTPSANDTNNKVKTHELHLKYELLQNTKVLSVNHLPAHQGLSSVWYWYLMHLHDSNDALLSLTWPIC